MEKREDDDDDDDDYYYYYNGSSLSSEDNDPVTLSTFCPFFASPSSGQDPWERILSTSL